MHKRIKVGVLMGGKSPEHKISLITGKEVVNNLNPKKYKILLVKISKDGKTFQQDAKKYPLGLLSNVNCQLFFIALHGPYGEDGTIQGFLQSIGIPYTGSGVLASALGMDKIYSRKLFTQTGLKTPKYIATRRSESVKKVFKTLKLPFFVKPNNQGSSVGTSKVKKKKDLEKALRFVHKFSEVAIIEEFVSGIEVTCAIIGNDKPQALPLVEIVPKKEFFDYEAKYNERFCDEIVPARINQSLTQKAQKAAISAYQALGARGFGRVDMIIKGSVVYILEVNTIPGLTPISLFPKAAKAAGISYPKLLDKIIKFAIP